ncbi:hypothetical protein T484DRAFT_1741619 [Baffinella frigidus]|nr:hypothetical protein T484DRAFT_1741619 [Cryptophyta sp. CCMP2293]
MAETVEGQPVGCIFAQFTSPGGEATGPQIEIPLDLNTKKLNGVINELLGNERSEPYSFYINDQEATFRVVAVTRCSGTLPGHTEAILCVAFSPDCQRSSP